VLAIYNPCCRLHLWHVKMHRFQQ